MRVAAVSSSYSEHWTSPSVMASEVAGENGAPRKRARSGSTERDEKPGSVEELPRKASKSDLSVDDLHVDRVALLDAGAQYGKVHIILH